MRAGGVLTGDCIYSGIQRVVPCAAAVSLGSYDDRFVQWIFSGRVCVKDRDIFYNTCVFCGGLRVFSILEADGAAVRLGTVKKELINLTCISYCE